MIEFNCDGCGKSFSLPDQFAGRKASCKACGASVVVPFPKPAVVRPATPMDASRLPVRTRRLIADASHIAETFANSPTIRVVETHDDPPERYTIEFNIKGLRVEKGRPKVCESHRAEIQLTSEYPRVAPLCRMVTPIFHPNIDETTICVGDHWAAGERLADLVVRIGEMIAYQAYNIKSPLNAEAAMWADLHAGELPIDSRAIG